MALKITITDDKGITTKYHKIASVTITDRIAVTLKSYADESYRKKEKQAKDNAAEKERISMQIVEEQVKEEPDQALIASLTAEAEALNTEVADCSVGSMVYKLPFSSEDEISFKAIYEALKKEASFSDAEDC